MSEGSQRAPCSGLLSVMRSRTTPALNAESSSASFTPNGPPCSSPRTPALPLASRARLHVRALGPRRAAAAAGSRSASTCGTCRGRRRRRTRAGGGWRGVGHCVGVSASLVARSCGGDFLLRLEIPTDEDLADSRCFGFWTLLRRLLLPTRMHSTSQSPRMIGSVANATALASDSRPSLLERPWAFRRRARLPPGLRRTVRGAARRRAASRTSTLSSIVILDPHFEKFVKGIQRRRQTPSKGSTSAPSSPPRCSSPAFRPSPR